MNRKQHQEQNEIWNWNVFSKYRTLLLGCAILGITFCHLDIAQIHNGLEVSILANILHVFTAFVDVFMFLSGLGLYYSMRKNPGRSYLDYLKRRVIRIIPLYLIMSGITYIVWDIVLQHETLGQVLKDMFFVSWVTSGSTKYWFVPAVLIFYAVFPAIYQFLHKDNRGLPRLIMLLIVFIAVTGVLQHCFEWYDTFQIAIERFPVFVIGAYCGKLSYDNAKIPNWMVAAISAMAIISTVLMYGSQTVSSWIDNTHYVYYFNRMLLGLWMCFTIIFVLEGLSKICPAFCRTIRAVFVFLGGITLEVYLLHQSYMIVFDYPSGGGYALAAIILPIATASLIYLIRWKRKKVEKRG